MPMHRLDAGVARGLVHRSDAVHVAVVGDADRGLAVGGRRGHDLADPRRTVEHRVLGVEMQMDERLRHGHLVRLTTGLAARRSLSTAAWGQALWMSYITVIRRPDACASAPDRQQAAACGERAAPHLVGGERAVARAQLRLVGQRGVDERHGVRAASTTSPMRPRDRPRRARARAALFEQLAADHTHARSPTSSRAAADELARRALRARRGSGTGRRPPSCRRAARASPISIHDVAFEMHLAVVGRDEQRGVRRAARRAGRADELRRSPRARARYTRSCSPNSCATVSTPG